MGKNLIESRKSIDSIICAQVYLYIFCNFQYSVFEGDCKIAILIVRTKVFISTSEQTNNIAGKSFNYFFSFKCVNQKQRMNIVIVQKKSNMTAKGKGEKKTRRRLCWIKSSVRTKVGKWVSSAVVRKAAVYCVREDLKWYWIICQAQFQLQLSWKLRWLYLQLL